jgi:hypothetical protein
LKADKNIQKILFIKSLNKKMLAARPIHVRVVQYARRLVAEIIFAQVEDFVCFLLKKN